MNELLMLGVGVQTFCADAHEILGLVGWALTIFKIAIPLIIIGLGLLDLGKAAISSKPEEIKESVTSLMWRLIGGIAIFFLPTLIMMILGVADGFNDATAQIDFDICYDCIVSPWSDTCENAVSEISG